MKKIIFILLLFSFFGCKKDKLEGDKSVFVGKWKWVYSVKTVRDNCDNPPVITIINPSTEGKNYSIEFKEKGCVTFYENEDKIKKYRIIFKESGWQLVNTQNFNGYYEFAIQLDNNNDKTFYGFVSTDTLVERGYWFPYKNSDQSCITFMNYFVKE